MTWGWGKAKGCVRRPSLCPGRRKRVVAPGRPFHGHRHVLGEGGSVEDDAEEAAGKDFCFFGVRFDTIGEYGNVLRSVTSSSLLEPVARSTTTAQRRFGMANNWVSVGETRSVEGSLHSRVAVVA